MKVLATLAVFVASMAAMAQAAATQDFLGSLAPAQCRDQCNGLSQQVGGCMEQLNSTFSASVNSADPASFTFSGDILGARDCVCSAEAFNAMGDCLACLNEAACMKDKPITVEDVQSMCNDGFGTLAALGERYHGSMCQAPPAAPECPAPPAAPECPAPPACPPCPETPLGSGGKKCCKRPM